MVRGTIRTKVWLPARLVLAGLFAVALVFASAVATAQEPPPAKPEGSGVFQDIARWLDRQVENAKSTFQSSGKDVENLGREAGIAAKTTVENAKDAADAVAKIPTARVMTGHEKCRSAPNGAPDCVAAATLLCKAKGFETGKSADMTTAEVCSAQVYLSGRNSGPGCQTETFVSRALCQ